MAYPVQNLIEGRGDPVSVLPSRSVEEALALMMKYDYSQLPVVDESKRQLGLITYESILRAQGYFGANANQLLVKDAVVRADSFRPEDDLFDVLERLKDTNAVLIVDRDNRLIGIVTSYDSNEFLRQRVEDMMLVEDIEASVKGFIQAAYSGETGEINEEDMVEAIDAITSSNRTLMAKYRKALCHYLTLQTGKPAVDSQSLEESFQHLAEPEKPKAFDELSLYEYIELLMQKSRWDVYQQWFNIEAEALRHMLNSARETRNALAHFRGEVSKLQRDQLRFCAQWLERHHPGLAVDWPIGVVEVPAESLVREKPSHYVTGEPSAEIVPTEEVIAPGDSKYAPLAVWLSGRPGREDRAQLGFQDVETIIDGELPRSAWDHRVWWANDSVGHVQSRQWLDVGWRVAQVNMTEAKVTFARIREREKAYIDFFSTLRTKLRDRPGFPLKEASPDGASWHIAAALPVGGPQYGIVGFAFTRERSFRIELYIDTGNSEKNKLVFDHLCAQREVFEAKLGAMSWERMDERRASRIAVYHAGHIADGDEELAELCNWGADTMCRFYDAIAEPANKAFGEVMEG